MAASPKIALVLTGGGARGAYQAGFLRGLSDISPKNATPFSIITGCSVGAINASFIACGAHDFDEATKKLWNLWATIKPEGIFIPRRGAFFKIAFNWLAHVILNRKKPFTTTLLDNQPLKQLLQKQLDFSAIQDAIQTEKIHAAAFIAMNYNERISTTFFDASSSVVEWEKEGTLGTRTTLSIDHVVGSAGLPLLFEPVKIENCYFGDGSIRLMTPLRPAICLGADKILVISTYELIKKKGPRESPPSFGRIIGTMLQTVFSDSLDSDLKRLHEENHFAGVEIDGKVLKNIPALHFKPKRDLSELLSECSPAFPSSYKKFLDLISGIEDNDRTFLSYLSFDPAYTTLLLEAGYRDAINQQASLEEFLNPLESH